MSSPCGMAALTLVEGDAGDEGVRAGARCELGLLLIPSAQRLVWAAKQALGKAALGALFA